MGLFDALFGPSQPQPPQGGLLGGGSRDAYNRYRIDATERGEPPLKYEDWLKKQQTPPPAPAPKK